MSLFQVEVFILVQMMEPHGNWLKVVGRVKLIRLYLIMKDLVYAGGNMGNILRSSNNGLSWQQITNNLPKSNIAGIALDSLKNLYSMTLDSGIFKSNDSGYSWNKVLDLPKGRKLSSGQIDKSGVIWVIMDSMGVYRSTNLGSSWEMKFSGYTVHCIAESPNGDYAVGATSDTGEVLLFQRSGSITWQSISIEGHKIYTISFAPNVLNPTLWVGTDHSLYVSNVNTGINQRDRNHCRKGIFLLVPFPLLIILI